MCQCDQCEDSAYGSSCKDLSFQEPKECSSFDDGCSTIVTWSEKDAKLGKVKRECAWIATGKCRETIGSDGTTEVTCTCTGDGCNGKNQKKISCYQCSGPKGSSCDTLEGEKSTSCLVPFYDGCSLVKVHNSNGYVSRHCNDDVAAKEKGYYNKCMDLKTGKGAMSTACHCSTSGCNNGDPKGNLSSGEKRLASAANSLFSQKFSKIGTLFFLGLFLSSNIPNLILIQSVTLILILCNVKCSNH